MTLILIQIYHVFYSIKRFWSTIKFHPNHQVISTMWQINLTDFYCNWHVIPLNSYKVQRRIIAEIIRDLTTMSSVSLFNTYTSISHITNDWIRINKPQTLLLLHHYCICICTENMWRKKFSNLHLRKILLFTCTLCLGLNRLNHTLTDPFE